MKPHHHSEQFNLRFGGREKAIALLTPLFLVFGSCGLLSAVLRDRVEAQIITDDSLGAESSVVTPNVEIKGELSDRL